MTYAKTEWLTWDLVEAQIVVNLSGTIHMTHSMLPFLRQAKGLLQISPPFNNLKLLINYMLLK